MRTVFLCSAYVQLTHIDAECTAQIPFFGSRILRVLRIFLLWTVPMRSRYSFVRCERSCLYCTNRFHCEQVKLFSVCIPTPRTGQPHLFFRRSNQMDEFSFHQRYVWLLAWLCKLWIYASRTSIHPSICRTMQTRAKNCCCSLSVSPSNCGTACCAPPLAHE